MMNAIKIYEDAMRELESNKITLGEFEQKIEPLKNVRENVHGEWKRDFSGNEFYWYCTNCKEEYYEEDLYMGGNAFPNFCPSCGADMKKDTHK